jgi:four helix bundle protein
MEETDDRGRRMGDRIRSFRDLRVYQEAFRLQQEVFEVSKGFPKEELYSLTDQIRRSSRSVGANLAEAWHKRRYEAHFLSKLSDSDGEQAETQHWLDTALTCKYVSEEEHANLMNQCKQIGRMLGKMMANPGPFCRSYTAAKKEKG